MRRAITVTPSGTNPDPDPEFHTNGFVHTDPSPLQFKDHHERSGPGEARLLVLLSRRYSQGNSRGPGRILQWELPCYQLPSQTQRTEYQLPRQPPSPLSPFFGFPLFKKS